jgi:hypothetical protein
MTAVFACVLVNSCVGTLVDLILSRRCASRSKSPCQSVAPTQQFPTTSSPASSPSALSRIFFAFDSFPRSTRASSPLTCSHLRRSRRAPRGASVWGTRARGRGPPHLSAPLVGFCPLRLAENICPAQRRVRELPRPHAPADPCGAPGTSGPRASFSAPDARHPSPSSATRFLGKSQKGF